MAIYMIHVRPLSGGEFLLGTLRAASPEEAQNKLVQLLERHGIKKDVLTLEVTSHRVITLKGDAELHISPLPALGQMLPIVIAFVQK